MHLNNRIEMQVWPGECRSLLVATSARDRIAGARDVCFNFAEASERSRQLPSGSCANSEV
jgi:hypothetical protein